MDGFARYLKCGHLQCKYARGTGAIRGREFHDYHEILFFLEGNVDFLSEQGRVKLRPGQLVIIPRESFHQFIITGDEDRYHRCVLNFYDDPELVPFLRSLSAVTVADATAPLMYLFRKAIALTEQEAPENGRLLASLLLLILSELPQSSSPIRQNGLTADCIHYISRHLTQGLTIPGIAKALHVSVSTLTHRFKQDMNTSVYRYILHKRLLLAQRRICDGENATNAATDCGFSDYSGFFKQYKKMFGTAPSERRPTF